MSSHSQAKPTVVVVGAGVIGLTCALEIANAIGSTTHIAVVASHLPTKDLGNPHYTSPWAGAHFRPFPNIPGNDYLEFEWPLTRATQARFRHLAEHHPESSVKFMQGVEIMENPLPEYTSLGRGYTEELSNFRVLKSDTVSYDYSNKEIAISKEVIERARLVTLYDTWTLNSPKYLQYLYQELVLLGVTFVRQTLLSLSAARELFPYVKHLVNCSGNGLLYNGGFDPLCYPIRGQTLLLRPTEEELKPYVNQTITHQSCDGKWTFIIPRPLNGGLILGGTKQVDDSTPIPKMGDTAQLLQGAHDIFPLLKATEAQIERINVGFRPARKTGFRLETEEEDGVTVIHAYGAGGMGFELSYGVAEEVRRVLVRDFTVTKAKF
ncbi:hypothetical protein BABINDRAFT_162986 [Babjeviella inositovora NRRL Y-12698]|uniref:FAD dependent oxidoreductase domain-containing protein n=1 Tax=Babjeviella inositovora NRRL Y-12698 TaxID=984486 RepID=A0A1E3QL57_9ASCO|nr:uncharacterized protein BABINDRAFT_162986 [Babjeviella inositovora NRRL Y-12698]ODQ78348.1 hypothetical protein BABINDRAFT_162986 [Babjeviella inositovora NRRL Y-12698]